MISLRITKRIVVLIGIALFLGMVPAAFSAQDACPALVQQALDDLGQNCNALDRNSACYGYNRVDATFNETVEDTFFSNPADRTGLKTLASIQTAPLSVDQKYWGIAVLNVQANVPNTLPGQAVTFVLLGDVAVDNDVDPNSAFEPGEPITIKTVTGANIRSLASAKANLIGSVPSGTELSADAVSQDGRWIRVLYSSGVGWVTREVIQSVEGEVDSLPAITSETRSPMQAFTFRTTPGSTSCDEAPPSLLVVQGPDNVKVDITANGADIRLGSTIALRILEGNRVQLMVVDGEAQIGGLKIPAGFTIFAQLGEDGTTITGDWTNFRALSPDELGELQGLENLPDNLLHYPITIPTEEDIQEALEAFSETSTTNSNTVGSTTTGPAAGTVNCDPFRPTSPLGGLPFGATTFYWDAAPGATSYRVNLYNGSGGLSSSYDVSAPQTSVVGDTSNLGGGFMFAWDVQALFNGQVACTSGRVTSFREAPQPPAATFQPTPSFVCNFNESCETGESETCADCWSE